MKLLVAFLLSVSLAPSQIVLKFTPEPIILSAAAKKDIGRWKIEACNNGPVVESISRERLSIAAGSKLRIVDDQAASSILTTETDRTLSSQLVKALTYAGEGLGLALAIASKSNARVATVISGASSFLPLGVQAAKGYTPTALFVPSSVQYPVQLGPSQCFTDHVWAAKVKQAVVIEAEISSPSSSQGAPAVVAPPPPAAPAKRQSAANNCLPWPNAEGSLPDTGMPCGSPIPASKKIQPIPPGSRIRISREALAQWDVSQIGYQYVFLAH